MISFIFNILTGSAQPAAHGTSAWLNVSVSNLQLGPLQVYDKSL
jgi:hypothetical protein